MISIIGHTLAFLDLKYVMSTPSGVVSSENFDFVKYTRYATNPLTPSPVINATITSMIGWINL